MLGFRSLALIGVGIAAMTAQTATAQEFFKRDRNVGVLERPQPEFDPEPVRLGAVEARSSLGLGGYFIDNVFATEENEVSDFAFTIRPEVDLRSTWSRHEVGADAQVEHFEFINEGSESVTNVRGGVRGRLDVNRNFYVTAFGFGSRRHEQRTQISILDEFGEPVRVNEFGGGISGVYERDRIQLRLGYDIRDQNFNDVETTTVGDIDQDFRDNLRHTVTGRAAYAVTRDFAVFTQASYFQRDFDNLTQLPSGVAASRDSTGFTVQGGVNFELAAPFRGDIAVGYLEENRDSPLFADISGLSVDGRLQWFPTRLTTVTLTGSRRTTDVGLIEAAAATSNSGNLRIDHELRRNFTVLPMVEFSTPSLKTLIVTIPSSMLVSVASTSLTRECTSKRSTVTQTVTPRFSPKSLTRTSLDLNYGSTRSSLLPSM